MADLRSRSRLTRQQQRRRRALLIAAIAGAAAITLAAVAVIALNPRPQASQPTPSASRTPNATPTPTPTPIAEPEAPPAEPPSPPAASDGIDDPNSITVVANKQRPLNPVDYSPGDLRTPQVPYGAYEMRAEAATAVEQMFAAFLAETGQEMESISGFRSYDSQVRTYNGWVSSLGQAQADQVSARPGYSEHQTGLSIDIASVPASCSLEECFAQTTAAQWGAANAYRFGMVLRYPADKTEVTGYAYEPWHFRYVGVDVATDMAKRGISTLEEYFGLPAAPGY